jgi:NitT/TauT family transport system substrate-binding protein
LTTRRAEAIAQSFARGAIFAMANPEAEVRIVWEVWPHTKPTGKDETTALADEQKILAARAKHWRRASRLVCNFGARASNNFT